MRKLLLILLLACPFAGIYAQKLDDVKEKISKGKWDEAKEKLDKAFTDPKAQTNSVAWFYKAQIYSNLSKANPNDTALARGAVEAMANYLRLEEPQGTKGMILSTIEGNKTFFDIYSNNFNAGINSFKNKEYTASLNHFKNTLESFSYLSKYNFTPVKLDTTATIYAALSAHNAKLFPEAARYYGMLVDARVPDSTYVDAYQFLISYNLSETKDTATAKKYLKISQEVYPKRNWLDYELSMIPNERDARLAAYSDLLTRYPDNADLTLQYAVDLYNSTYVYDKKPADYNDRKQQTQKALNQAMAIDPESQLGNYIYSQHAYNEVFDLEDELRSVKGTTAADVAKKKDLTARIDKQYEEMYKYSLKTYDLYSKETNLKIQDRANYRRVINQLIDYHTRKKQNDKVTFYEEKLKQLK